MANATRRWTSLLTDADYEALVEIAEELDCTPSEVVRMLIRNKARRLGIIPARKTVSQQGTRAVAQA